MRNYMKFPGKFTLSAIIMEIGILIFFGFFVRYDLDVGYRKNLKTVGNISSAEVHVEKYYSMFQDIHIMMFIGFGFLMTFLKRYGFSSVGFNFLVGAFVLQWDTIIHGFIDHFADSKSEKMIRVGVDSITGADFAAAAILISFGAVLGKVSPLQLLIMATFEIIFYEGNYKINIGHIKAMDVGDSMIVHMFGAYFGLMVSWVLYSDNIEENEEKEGSVYQSDLFSMIGTIFLWMSWPSFNASACEDDERVRAIVNTYYSLTSSCICAFLMSSLVSKGNKFDMVHIQNATLAGGVAVGSFANMYIEPWGAILTGMVAGVVSVLGFKFLSPFMKNYMKLHDTCGVHNLHGIPGLISGFGSILAAGLFFDDFVNRKKTSTNPHQAGMQAACIGVTLGFSIFGGLITGLILKLPIFDHPVEQELFDDDRWWHIPLDEQVTVNSKYLQNDMVMKNGEELTRI